MSARLRLTDIVAGYEDMDVLCGLSLDVEPGELMAVVGPSGCGKTTLLKVIAGLMPARSGRVFFDNAAVDNIPAERRHASMMFQKPLLFPYLSVRQNVEFGLKMQHLAKPEIDRRVAHALAMVRMKGYETRRPGELSGGQEQRVALARALVTSPRILLLDEPLSALDESLRAEIRSLLREAQQQLAITTLFVTHDQREGMEIADRMAILLQGRIQQAGPPREFFVAPANPAVARFFGWQLVPYPGGIAAFRPEHAQVVPIAASRRSSMLYITGRLTALVDLGTRLLCTVRDALGNSYLVEQPAAPPGPAVERGAEVSIQVPQERVRSWEGTWNPSTSF